MQLAHQHRAGTPPLTGAGYITLESAKVATPSAAKTLANLRATPHMSIGPTKAVTVAGLHGRMFDATVTGSDLSGTCPGGSACPQVVSLALFRVLAGKGQAKGTTSSAMDAPVAQHQVQAETTTELQDLSLGELQALRARLLRR